MARSRNLGLLALEPRWMFDGAAVATAAHAAPDASAKALIPTVPAPVEVRAANPALDGGRTEVVFIDTSLANYQALEAAQKPGVEIEEIAGGASGLAQIAIWAESHTSYDSISVIGHGTEATLHLGTDTITDASLADPVVQAELAEIGAALKSGGELLVFADGVGQGADGQQLCADLATATGATIGIFGDPTDSTGGDGNWTLDMATGTIEVQAAQPALDGGLTEVVFVDTNVTDYQALVAAVKPGIEIELFGGTQDGLAEMAAWAATHSGYESISVLSHGTEAELLLGSDLVVDGSLSDSATRTELAQIGAALKPGGDLLLYACDVAMGSDGQQFVQDIATATGAVVAASPDIVGNGGGWNLEYSTGAIQFGAVFDTQSIDGYSYVLDFFTCSDGFITYNGESNGTANFTFTWQGVNCDVSTWGEEPYAIITGNWGGSTGVSAWNGFGLGIQFIGTETTTFGITPSASGNYTINTGYMYDNYGSGLNTYGPFSGTAFSYVAPPQISSVTYTPSTGILYVYGSNLTTSSSNWILSDLSLKGGANQTYTLNGSDSWVAGGSSSSVAEIQIASANRATVNALFDQPGTTSAEGTAYSLAGSAGWDSTSSSSAGCAVTLLVPDITGTTYNPGTGVLTLSGSNFTTTASNYTLGDLTLKGGSGGTYTLGNGDSVASASSGTVTIDIASGNQATVDALFDKGGPSSLEGTTYNLAATAGWDTTNSLAQAANTVTATDSVSPTLTHSGSTTVTTEATVGWAAAEIDNGTVTVTDTPNDWEGGKLVVTDGSGADTSHDTLTIGAVGLITTSGSTAGSTVSYNGTVIGTIKSGSTGTPGTSLEIDFSSASATDTAIAALVKAIQFSETVAGTPTVGNRTVTFALTSPYSTTASLSDTVDSGNFAAITSATYNAATGALVLTGGGFTTTASNYNPSLLTLTGDDGTSYALTTANSAVSAMSGTGCTLTLNAADKLAVNGLLDQNGTAAYSGTVYNLAASGSWDTGSALAVSTMGVTVSNVAAPSVTSATYNAGTHALVVTGTNIDDLGSSDVLAATKLTLTGDLGTSYTLTGGTVSSVSATGFTVTLAAADDLAINALLNANGTKAGDATTTYNLAAATGWDTGASAAVATAGVTVSGVTAPAITSASYNAGTHVLTVTGTNIVQDSGSLVDTKLTVKGDLGTTYTLTGGTVSSVTATGFTVTLNAADDLAVGALLNANGTKAGDGTTTTNLAAAAGWDTDASAAVTTTGVTTSGFTAPAIASATYNATTNTLTVTGSNIVEDTASLVATKLTVKGDLGTTYTLTGGTLSAIGATGFTVALNSADGLAIDALFNANGTKAGDGTTTTNLAAAAGWDTDASAAVTTAGVTTSGFTAPSITSATFNAGTGTLTVTGTNIVQDSGSLVDTKLTVKGDLGATYTLTGGTVSSVSATGFTITLNAADDLAVDALLNANGTKAGDGATTTNLAAAAHWDTDASAAVATVGVTTSGFTAPAISSATYNAANHVLTVTGTNILSNSGSLNPAKLTLNGDEGVSYTLTGGTVSAATATGFSVTLNGTDQAAIEPYLDANGTHPAINGGATYAEATISAWDTDAGAAGGSATITVTTTNHVPDLAATGGAKTFTEAGSAVSLFTAATADVGALDQYTGQTIQSITLTVTNVTNGASEILTVDGTAVALTNGNGVTTTDGYGVAVTVASGTATVTLSKSGNIAVAAVPALIDGITYQNTSVNQTSGSTRTVTLTSIVDSGGTANSGANTGTPTGTAAVVTLHAIATPPTLTGVTEANASVATAGTATQLFTAATTNAVVTGQDITGVTLAVSGLADGAGEQIEINGTWVSLTSGASGTAGGIGYAVGTVGGGATALTLTKTDTAANWNGYIESLAYRDSNGGSATTAGMRSFAITAISDNGSTSWGGTPTTTYAASTYAASVTLVANDTPVVSVPSGQTITDTSQHAISGVSVADTYSGGTLTATVTAQYGTLNFTGTDITGNNSASVTITAAGTSALNTILATLKYTTTATTVGTDTITIAVDDNDTGGIGGAKTGSNTIAVTIANSTLVVTVPSAQTIATTGLDAISGTSVAETFGGSTLTATLTDSHGVIDVGQGGGNATISGQASASVTVTGSLAAVNDALGTLEYQTTLTANGTDGIVIHVADSTAAIAGSATIGINVVGNDTPVVTVGGAQTFHDTQSHAITGISVGDQFGGASATATVTATEGDLTVTAGSATVTGQNTGTVTISGSEAAINAALATLQYATTATVTGSDTITVSYDDNGTNLVGGAKTGSAAIGVTLIGNQAPVIATPATQTFADTLQHAVTGLSVSDTYSGSSVTATVSDLHGTLDFTASGAASLTANDSGSVTIAGSLADVNATLSSLKYTTTATATTSDTISVTVDDNGASASLIGGSKTGTAGIAVTLVGDDTPVVTVPALQTVTDTSQHAISGVSVAATDGSSFVATVSDLYGTLDFTASGAASIATNDTGSVRITGSLADVNATLASLKYATTATGTTTDTITVSVDNNDTTGIGGAKTGGNGFQINLVADQPPVVTVPATEAAIDDTDPHTLSGIGVADAANSGATFTATVSAQYGTLTATGMTSSNVGSTLTVTDTLANVNAALATVAYTASTGVVTTSGDVVTVSVNDNVSAGIGGAQSASRTIAITTVANDTPSVAAPTALTITDTTAHAVTGLSVTDTQGSASEYTATVSDSSGHLAMSGGSGSATIAGSGTASVGITATTLADINAALATLTYTATATASGSDTIQVAVDDHGSDASLLGGSQTGTGSIGVALIGNDTPALTAPGLQTVTTNTANAISGISLADTYSGPDLTATLTDSHGTLHVTGAGVSGDDTNAVTVTAVSPTALNAILGTLTYTSALTATGADTIAVTVNDNGSNLIGGAKSATSDIAVNVIGNDTPVVGVPGEQSVSDTASRAISGVGVTDSAGAASVSATLTALHGNLSVSAGGVTVTGQGSDSVTVTGSLSAVNTALGTLTYATTATATGTDTITVTVDDNATTLVGGAKTGSATIAVTLIGNDTPVLTLAGAQYFSDTDPHALSGAGFSDSYSGTTVTADISDTSGLLQVTTAGGLTVSNNDSTHVTLSGSLSTVDTALDTLTYAATNSGGDTVTLTVGDGNTAGIGGAKSATGTIAVTVFGNDTPVVTVPTGTQTFDDTLPHTISGVSVSDIYGGASATATVSATWGDLTVTAGSATVTNNGTGSVTITGAEAAVNAAMATLQYATTATAAGSDTITVSYDDNGTSLIGGAKTGANTIAVSLVANDTPVVTVPGVQTFNDILQHAVSGVSVADTYSAASVTATVSASHGVLDLTSGTGAAVVTNNDTGAVTVTGSRADVNTALATLKYTTTQPTPGSDTITVALDDNATTLVGGAKTGTATIAVTAAPTITTQATMIATNTDVISGTAQPGTTVKVYDGATLVGTGTVDNSGRWSATAEPLSSGANLLSATDTNLQGITSAPSGTVSITVQLPLPPPPPPQQPPQPPPAPAIVETPPPPPSAPPAEAPVLVTAIWAVAAEAPAFTQGTQGGGGDAVAAKAASLNASGGGFQIALATPSVNAVRDGSLFVQNGIPSVVTESSVIAFTIPTDAFGHTSSEASVQLSAKLIDGKPLPPWLSFDTTRGTFVGEVPPDFRGALSVIVVAHDSAGHEVSTTFRIEHEGGVKEGEPVKAPIGEGTPAGATRHGSAVPARDGKPIRLGRPSFSQQLKMASRNAARRIA